ncbi:hypothetical protein [Cyclobacterium plantarum]|uniref:Uncharacterized protein n=1 Tax=Cyclobacterium plantarum TaxID=2716263 RepID=A0ABX0HAM0_9BACT|nr:hypothetical protein [Cyclobacterium plantarum]NHE57953.1 hypothetical protein [Cyclobacterium plantarum]
MAFEAGLSLNDFYDLTPIEFHFFIKGFENERKHQYNLARFQSYYSIKPHLDKKAQSKSIEQLIPFNWESKKEIKKLTEKEFRDLQKKWNFL